MSVFGKKGQGFADYMSSIEEIDLNSGTIFHSKEEALIYSMENHKKAVEFKLKK